MRLYFGLITFGLIVAALCGAALSWDAGAILFQVLDQQMPVIPNGRMINLLLQAPVLLASQFSSNLDLLQLVYGLMYVAVPLIGLVAAWVVVRHSAPFLFVWPALSVGLGMLPGLFNFSAEANMVLQLFWPVFFAVLLGVRRAHTVLIALLSLVIVLSHPYGIGLLAGAAVLAFIGGLRRNETRRWEWRWAAGFAMLTVLAVLKFVLFRTTYESSLLASDALNWSFDVSTAGLPMLALGCTAVATLAVFFGPFAAERWDNRLAPLLRLLGITSIGAVAVVLLLWARDPHLWQEANRYTYPALPISLAFMLVAALDYLVHTRGALSPTITVQPPRITSAIVAERTRTAQAAAAVCALVLAVQGVSWFNLTNQLRDTLSDSPWACVSMAPLGWLQKTPLDQFAAPGYALLLQGRTPEHLLLQGDGCTTTSFSDGVALSQYYTHYWGQGWFDLQPVQQRLVKEQQGIPSCQFGLTTGWYPTETAGTYWWRWSDGKDARMHIISDHASTATLNGQIETLNQPNRVSVLVNGVTQTTLTIGEPGQHEFGPLPVSLNTGSNEVRFVSQNEAELQGGRLLAMDVANVTVVTSDPPAVCTHHP